MSTENFNDRVTVTAINDHIYLMDDNRESTGYLVIGSRKAAVIDTMNGLANVREIAERYTDLPLMVINTHGHPDHIYGNVFFDEAYVSAEDLDLCEEFCHDPAFLELVGKYGHKMPPFRTIAPGEIIDLGGLHLEVIALAGHTPGSVLLLLKEDRILFTGDAINHHLWMQIPDCLPLKLFEENLEKVQYLSEEADHILHGHATGTDDIALLSHTLDGIREILSGKTVKDEDYQWFGGVSRQHPIPDDEGVICYNPTPDWVVKERAAWAEGDAKRDAGLREPEDLVKYRDLRYGPFGEYSLLDVYRPASKDGALPVLINVHGGGYFYGDKELYRFYAMDMARYGFAVINMNYRLSPEFRFPSPLSDINRVMHWIRDHADTYGLDTDHIFLMGDSAGAQLVSQYAAINTNPEYAKEIYLKPHGLKVKGISLACGMYDVKKMIGDETDRFFKIYLAGYYDRENTAIDVCSAITAAYPPAYLFSSPNDFLYGECGPMADLIRERGGTAVMKIYGTKEMTEVGHVFHCNMKTDIGREARRDQAQFLLDLVRG